MAQRRRLAAALVMAALLTVCIAGCRPSEHISRNGLYVWDTSDGALQSLWQVLDQVAVGEVYLSYSSGELYDQLPQQTVTQLHSRGLASWYLAGTPAWGIDSEGTSVRAAIAAVALYNRTVPKEAQFAGIQLDVEPYLTDAWDEDKQQVMQDWYRALYAGKQLAERYGVRVMLCIPRWLDAVNAEVLEAMLRDCCDEVAIMNYDRRDTLEGIIPELELARQYARPVVCISELTEPGIHGLTENNTYYNVGLEALHNTWVQLQQSCPDNDLRFAYHHLTPLTELLTSKNTSE